VDTEHLIDSGFCLLEGAAREGNAFLSHRCRVDILGV
jgi:hypothetical protein